MLKLTANECRMLVGMMDWAWEQGGVRAETQAVALLTIKRKILMEMEETGKKVKEAPDDIGSGGGK
jgi:hypothetical protein